MSQRIDDHKYSIEDAFKECFYLVPDYQREYVWTDKEVTQLLDDVNEKLDGGSAGEYFIGTVLVSRPEDSDHYEVIDGQQRLTTFFILLCALRNTFRNRNQHEGFGDLIATTRTDESGDFRRKLRLELGYENAREVTGKLFDCGDSKALRCALESAGIAVVGSVERIINAFTVIERYLAENYDDPAKLKKYWSYLARKVVFIQICTDVSSALKIFETINERGIGLNPMDLLKNLLFTRVQREEFTKLKHDWEKVTKPLEMAKEKPLRFLRYYLMANFKVENKRNDSVIREDEIYDWLVQKQNAALCGYIDRPFDFVRQIARGVSSYLNYIKGMGNDGNANAAMDNLRLLCGGAFSLHHVLLLAASGFPKELFDHFVKQLESFLFYYIFTKSKTNELERNFSIWADELRAVSEVSDRQEQVSKLNCFVKERFQTNMVNRSQELTDALKRYTLHAMQGYRTRYLLAKLAQHVDMAYKGLAQPGPLRDYTVLEIEHILPDNPKDELRRSFESAVPGAQYDDSKTRLGNLTLLEKPINIVASNNFFNEKVPEYKKCKCYLTSSIAELNPLGTNTSINRINSRLLAFTKWDASSIERRQQMLVDLAGDVWKVDLTGQQ